MRLSDSGLPAPPGNSASGSRPSGYGRERAPGSKLGNVRAGRSHTHTHTHTHTHGSDAVRDSPPHTPVHFTDIPSTRSHEALTPSRPAVHTHPSRPLATPRAAAASTRAGATLRAGAVCCCPPCTWPTGPEATGAGVALGLVCAVVFLPAALLTTRSSSRLSLESSALCVDSAARTPRPSVTPLSFSPSAGGT